MTGLLNEVDVSEARVMARRQLTGSIVAGILVLAVATLVGLRPASHSPVVAVAAHGGVQQPLIIAPSDHMIASAKRRMETP
jgi:hypothetical protein